MSMLANRALTAEEWAARPEDALGELVDGSLVEEEMPTYVHETVVAWLLTVLRLWGRGRSARVVGSGLRLALGEATGRIPDLAVFLPGAARPPVRGAVRTPPSIVVEVVSATAADARRDRIEKVGDYARFGVRWYWLLDPELRTLEVLERDAAGRFAHAIGRSDGVVDGIPGCEGLRLDLDALWRELDEVIAEATPDAGEPPR